MPLLRTILRRSFFTAAAVSTLLLLATLILWPVSYLRQVQATFWIAAQSRCDLIGMLGRMAVDVESFPSFVPGGIEFSAGRYDPGTNPDWSYLTWNKPYFMNRSMRTSLGITWLIASGPPDERFSILLIPISYLALLFFILPLLAFRSIRRRRKASRIGLCPKCGYDLRVQRDGAAGAVCPECGTPVAGRGRP
jgi:hypothetical protein